MDERAMWTDILAGLALTQGLRQAPSAKNLNRVFRLDLLDSVRQGKLRARSAFYHAPPAATAAETTRPTLPPDICSSPAQALPQFPARSRVSHLASLPSRTLRPTRAPQLLPHPWACTVQSFDARLLHLSGRLLGVAGRRDGGGNEGEEPGDSIARESG